MTKSRLAKLLITLFILPFFFVLSVSHAETTTPSSDIQTNISQYHKIKNALQKIDKTTASPEALTLQKEALKTICAILSQSLQAQKDQLATFQSLDQSERDNLLALLGPAIDKFNTTAATVDDISSADSLKTVAKDVLTLWQSTQAQYKKTLGQTLLMKLTAISTELETQLTDLQNKSAEFKSANKDVSKLDAQIGSAQKSLADLKQNNAACQTKLDALNSSSDPDLAFQDAVSYFSSSSKSISTLWQNIGSASSEVTRLSQSNKSKN